MAFHPLWADELARIKEAAKTLPIVFASSFTVGVNTLFWLTRKATELLGPDFDLEVIEIHHRLKKESPSGTARTLVEILADVRGLEYDIDCSHGRFSGCQRLRRRRRHPGRRDPARRRVPRS